MLVSLDFSRYLKKGINIYAETLTTFLGSVDLSNLNISVIFS